MWEIVSYTVEDGYIIGLTGFFNSDQRMYNLASYNVEYEENKFK